MNKRVNYMELLKESVADRGHDTTKSVDMKGPFLDPILGYDGGGELPTYKDASSILERYYFNQDADKGVNVAEDASIRQVGDDKGALKDEPEDVDKSKADAAKATELKEKQGDLGGGDDFVEEDDSLLEDDVENAVIERLIAEMEEDEGLLFEGDDKDDDDDDDDKDDDDKDNNKPTFEKGVAPTFGKKGVKENSPPQDPAAKNHEPSGDPDKDKSGLVDGDDHKGGEGAVKPATFPAGSDGVGKGIKAAMKEDLDSFDELLMMEEEEAPEITAGDKETPDDDKDKELDVDKEMKDVKESGSPIGNPGTADEFEALEEAFDIFTEAMDDDDVAELDDDDIMV